MRGSSQQAAAEKLPGQSPAVGELHGLRRKQASKREAAKVEEEEEAQGQQAAAAAAAAAATTASSEEQLLRRRRHLRVRVDDHVLRTSLLYICGSCLILIIVFLTLLPGALINYLRRINFLKDVVASDIEMDSEVAFLASARGGRAAVLDSGSPAVFCHLNLSAFARPGNYRYTVHDVPANVCTHVVFPLHALEDWFDDMLNYDAYQRAQHPSLYTSMEYLKKRKALQVLVYVDAEQDHHGRRHLLDWIGSDPNSEMPAMVFARNLVKWLLSNQLHGLVVEGMFPAPEPQRGVMVRLLKKMHTLFKQANLILVAVVEEYSALTHQRAFGKRLKPFVDFLVIRNRKQHEAFFHQVLEGLPDAPADADDVTPEAGLPLETVRQAILSGLPRKQLLVSLEMDTATLRVESNKTLPGLEGPLTNTPGLLAYFEVCTLFKDNTWSNANVTELGNPVALKENEAVSYENAESVHRKALLVRNYTLGGIMMWDVTSDDYRGVCGVVNPLSRAVGAAMAGA
ncbi:chitinase-3-like protein 2 [Dermacentor variabilis]|uniref:chitinase-3-like protein 2 n=1 Tax=Dermacentor variabilis TaxID=34621 RepID=UPI003F5BB21E